MRMNLQVPYAEKDQAKQLGARWDAARKTWYFDDAGKIAEFARWSPTPAASGGSAAAAAPVSARQAAGKLVVGSDYVETAQVCDCPPWAACGRCQPAGR